MLRYEIVIVSIACDREAKGIGPAQCFKVFSERHHVLFLQLMAGSG